MQVNGATQTAPSTAPRVNAEQLRQACGEFESLFTYTLLKNAREAMPQGGILGHSQESKIFQSLLDEKMAIQASKGRGLGLGEMLYRQLSPKHGAQPAGQDRGAH